ncbi:MAG: DciA family protein [Hyphomicrobiaceae bacterium]
MAASSRHTPWGGGLKLGQGVNAIGALVPEVTRRAFEKHGFPAGRLALDWTAIVGAELARFTRPEKIKWPRPIEDDEESASAGATLVLRVEGARALDVQYRAGQIMERINGFLGYRAITELRIVQAPVVCKLNVKAAPSPRPRPRDVVMTPATAGTPLDNALARLAQSVAAASRHDGR